MPQRDKLEQIRSLLEDSPDATSVALVDLIREQYGGIGFLYRTLAEENPDAFIRYVLDGDSVLGTPRSLDPKTQELVAIASATASLCDHCIKAHIGSARSNGASWQEILDTILIAAHVTESSALSVALRSYKQEKARHAHSTETDK